MSRTLVIVESPAKAKTIGKFLGKKYMVKASMGHVRDLPKSQFGVDVKNGFKPKYITIRGKGETIKDLKTAVKKADQVLIASDPDREGEAIAWHLQNLLEISGDQPCRIEFNEITKQAIQKAARQPRLIDFNRVNAQQARRILDRLVGYNLSPLLWRKVKKGLSAGRVQSVAVRLICDREAEIQAFEPEEYWTLTGLFVKTGHTPFEGKLVKHQDKKIDINDKQAMQEVLDSLKGAHYVVAKVVRKEKSRRPAPPFITSTLQQEAYRKLNFTARKTMMVAQQLYEGLDLGKEGTSGLVTYIRTDSTRVSASAREETARYIGERFGAPYVGRETAQTGSRKGVQDAHEAIRPTSIYREPDQIKGYLTNDQYKLYRLIWSRFLASQMSHAVFDTTSVDINAGPCVFRATGSVIKFPGFMKVYTESRDNDEKDEESLLPELKEGEEVEARKLTPKQNFTQPPPRYTEATLVKTLEEKGIGRPSTYAPIVETIIKRGYVVRENKQFYPTELGDIVVSLLKNHFHDVIDVEFTAGMEEKLDEIEEGDLDWVKVLDDFYWPFNSTLEKAEEEIGHVQVADEVTEEVCEQCGRNMVIKLGRFGKFLACPGFPECRSTRPLLEPVGVKCPRCEGELVARRSKKGRKFFGCSRFPDCDFVTWDQPSKVKCPACGDLMVEKKSAGKASSLRCINPNCSHKLTPEKKPAPRKKSTGGKKATAK
ncbi:type I DNA topoisomerase [Pelotomaculum propionicicum]|uniref:DNA topoisomerase 1 n=1 Tax=Pelotomaculum propionicicum TaxID=258475 RepID=A0A4Y7RMF5_9FIRM|nr:type I DNA topoisomerase [Pelotomaculum propionicicum]NLI11943.1 type I DNA topoisomerase [Peptococcaceae bacterium]TEB10155.1 DNA topoisomerase 1 [Pelotomaculum propionicicum]